MVDEISLLFDGLVSCVFCAWVARQLSGSQSSRAISFFVFFMCSLM